MITPSEVLSLLEYNPLTGLFRWRDSNYSFKKDWFKGAVGNAGRYCYIRIKRRTFTAHKLAWVCFYGEWPVCSLDHINRDGLDNRLYNLRLATRAQNGINRGKQRNNTSGYKGVIRNRQGNWFAQIKKDRRAVYLGIFPDRVSAAKAYDAKAREMFGVFATLNFPNG